MQSGLEENSRRIVSVQSPSWLPLPDLLSIRSLRTWALPNPLAAYFITPHCFQFSKETICKYLSQICVQNLLPTCDLRLSFTSYLSFRSQLKYHSTISGGPDLAQPKLQNLLHALRVSSCFSHHLVHHYVPSYHSPQCTVITSLCKFPIQLSALWNQESCLLH